MAPPGCSRAMSSGPSPRRVSTAMARASPERERGGRRRGGREVHGARLLADRDVEDQIGVLREPRGRPPRQRHERDRQPLDGRAPGPGSLPSPRCGTGPGRRRRGPASRDPRGRRRRDGGTARACPWPRAWPPASSPRARTFPCRSRPRGRGTSRRRSTARSNRWSRRSTRARTASASVSSTRRATFRTSSSAKGSVMEVAARVLLDRAELPEQPRETGRGRASSARRTGRAPGPRGPP